MKKIRYVAGAVGLAPLALGIVTPAHARAAAAPNTTTAGKKVSLPRTGIHLVPSTQSCYTSQGFTIPQAGDLKGHGWQADNDSTNNPYGQGTICVGTVVESVKFNAGTSANKYCKYVWASWYLESPNGNQKVSSPTVTPEQRICGIKGQTKIIDYGVHRTWYNGSGFPFSSSLRVNIWSKHSGTKYATGIWLN